MAIVTLSPENRELNWFTYDISTPRHQTGREKNGTLTRLQHFLVLYARRTSRYKLFSSKHLIMILFMIVYVEEIISIRKTNNGWMAIHYELTCAFKKIAIFDIKVKSVFVETVVVKWNKKNSLLHVKSIVKRRPLMFYLSFVFENYSVYNQLAWGHMRIPVQSAN